MADSLDLANRDPNGINPHLQVGTCTHIHAVESPKLVYFE